jgi:hypothetical protein
MFWPTRSAACDQELPVFASDTIRHTYETSRYLEQGNTDELDGCAAGQGDINARVRLDPSSNLIGITGTEIELVCAGRQFLRRGFGEIAGGVRAKPEVAEYDCGRCGGRK